MTACKYWLYWLGIWAVLVTTTRGEKTCHEMYTVGSYYNEQVEGYYDLVDGIRCYDRPIYAKRNSTGSNLYINYYRDTLFNMGWIISPAMCSANLQDSYFYVWNLNRRPDRVLLNWMEQNEEYWHYNKQFKIRCTLGLHYEAIVGIIIACVLGIPVIIIVIFIVVDRVKHRNRHRHDNRSIAPVGNDHISNLGLYSDFGQSAAINPGFQPDSAYLSVNNYVMAPPTYDEATSIPMHANTSVPPPAYDVTMDAIGAKNNNRIHDLPTMDTDMGNGSGQSSGGTHSDTNVYQDIPDESVNIDTVDQSDTTL